MGVLPRNVTSASNLEVCFKVMESIESKVKVQRTPAQSGHAAVSDALTQQGCPCPAPFVPLANFTSHQLPRPQL